MMHDHLWLNSKIATLKRSLVEHSLPVLPKGINRPRQHLALEAILHPDWLPARLKSSDMIICLATLPSITENVYRHA